MEVTAITFRGRILETMILNHNVSEEDGVKLMKYYERNYISNREKEYNEYKDEDDGEACSQMVRRVAHAIYVNRETALRALNNNPEAIYT
jgi:hypothetical protein